jgi:hypothetical protein
MRHPDSELTTRALHSAALALALALIGAGTASAQPDLEITSMSLVGTARQGACNTVALVVRNSGNQGTAVAGINTFMATYSQGNPNLNRAERTDMIGGVIQAGNTVPFNLTNVDFKAQGAMTVQALIDSTSKVAESNENNNSRTLNVNVSGSCTNTPPPPPTPTSTCDLKAIFTAPSGSSAPAGQPATFTINFSNPPGAGTCPAFKVKLMRSNGRTCGGYGSQVGGSGAWQAVGPVAPGGSATASFTEKNPTKGTSCYSLGYSPHAYNTQTNSHRPQKVVAFN